MENRNSKFLKPIHPLPKKPKSYLKFLKAMMIPNMGIYENKRIRRSPGKLKRNNSLFVLKSFRSFDILADKALKATSPFIIDVNDLPASYFHYA